MTFNVEKINSIMDKAIDYVEDANETKENEIKKKISNNTTKNTLENRENDYIETEKLEEESYTEEAEELSKNVEAEIENNKISYEDGISRNQFEEILSKDSEIKKIIEDFGIDDVFDIFDKDMDDKVTTDEIQEINSTCETLEDFTKGEIKKLLKDAEQEDENLQDIKDRLKEALGLNKEDDDKENMSNSVNSGSTSVGGGGGYVGGSGGGYSIGSGSSTGANSTNSSTKTETKGETLQELERKKTEKETEINKANDELKQVYSGENPEVKKAQEDYEKAEKDYKEKLEKDNKIDDKLKEQQKENIENIDNTQKEIDTTNSGIADKQAEISSQNTVIASDKANLEALKSSLAALPNPSDFPDNQEKQANIANQRSILETNIEKAEKQQSADEQKLEKLKKDLDKLNETLTTQKSNLEKYEKEQEKIEKEIEEKASDETKEALKAYNDAKANVQKVKTDKAKEMQTNIDKVQKELDSINKQIDDKKAEETKNEYKTNSLTTDFEFALTDSQKGNLEAFENHWAENKDKYQEVSERLKSNGLDFPAELIAAINWRESGGCFDTYLHNGEKLGQPTTYVPAGVYFENSEQGWMDAACDAILNYGCDTTSVKSNDTDTWFEYAEAYNGYGYRNHGCASAYVWAGTEKYTGGMYVADGVFDPDYYDTRVGVAAMVKSILE